MTEFQKRVLKVDGKRNHKVKNSIRTFDLYRYICRNKLLNASESITEHQFYTIIRTVHKSFVQDILKGKTIELPYNMGLIFVYKMPISYKQVNGKYTSNAYINWKKTLELWESDKDAYEERLLVKGDEKNTFIVHYHKAKARYKNKVFYTFAPTRQLRLALKELIINNKFDAFTLW